MATQESQKNTTNGQLSNADAHLDMHNQERQQECFFDEHTMAYPSSKLGLAGCITGVFAIKKQHLTAHLNILRDPNKWYHYGTPAYSPALGNASDAFIRLQQNKYRQLNIAKWELFNFPLVPWELATIDQTPLAELNNQLCLFINYLRSKNRGWVINSLPINRLIRDLDKERDFWRAFGENRSAKTNKSGPTKIKRTPNNETTTFREQLEVGMIKDGYSLDKIKVPRHAATETEAAGRHQKMDQHRAQWRQNNKIMKMRPILDDNDEEDSTLPMTCNTEIDTMSTNTNGKESEEDDDHSYLCSSTTSPHSLTTSDSKGEVITNVEHSPTTHATTSDSKGEVIVNIEKSPTTHAQPEISNISMLSTTQIPQVQASQPEPHNNMDIHSAMSTTAMNAEDKAISKLAKALVDDLNIRQTAYMCAANLMFNTAFYKLWAREPLRSKCTWIRQPVAMAPKNGQLPTDHLPAIRVITPEGVTCELIEAFEDISHPDWEEIFEEREDAQEKMQAKVKKWRDEMECFAAYERRLECEKFWEECRVKDIAQQMKEERQRCQEEGYEFYDGIEFDHEGYESDEDDDEDESDGEGEEDESDEEEEEDASDESDEDESDGEGEEDDFTSSSGQLSRSTSMTSMESIDNQQQNKI